MWPVLQGSPASGRRSSGVREPADHLAVIGPLGPGCCSRTCGSITARYEPLTKTDDSSAPISPSEAANLGRLSQRLAKTFSQDFRDLSEGRRCANCAITRMSGGIADLPVECSCKLEEVQEPTLLSIAAIVQFSRISSPPFCLQDKLAISN